LLKKGYKASSPGRLPSAKSDCDNLVFLVCFTQIEFWVQQKPRPARFVKNEQAVEAFIIANPSQDSTLISVSLALEKLFFWL